MPRKAAHEEPPVPRLLFDMGAVAQILSLSESTIDRLCQMGELHPSVMVGSRRLFTLSDLEKFAYSGSPKKIRLAAREEGGTGLRDSESAFSGASP